VTVRRCAFPIVVLLLLAVTSCTVQGASEKTRAAGSIAATDTSPAVAYSTDPQDALDQLADADGAVDQSRISDGPCGMFSLTVGPLGLRSYQWIEGRWTRLGGTFETEFEEPYLITTRDYDYDGVNEFMVNFDQNGDGPQISMFGAVLDESACSWEWVTFVTPNGPSTTVRNLVWDDNESWFTGSLVFENQEYAAIAQYGTDGRWYADFR
jgi:hypothetical protein